MKAVSFTVAALILAAVAAPAAAQQRGLAHAINPSISLSAPAANPLQAQIQDDYATQLQQTQRELLQQNPSGLTHPEIIIGHELNDYMAPR
jgi:hypothetical protein